MNRIKNVNYEEAIRFSFAWRGMAMLPYLNNSLVDQYLNEAENFGKKAVIFSAGIDSIVANENLFTCNQTLSKWFKKINQGKKAFEALDKMIALDPYDSVGYAEMAFLHLSEEDYFSAEFYFSKAVLLGPPSVGMHLFYQGYCLRKMNKFFDAEQCFLRAIDVDSAALSPYLALYDLYAEIKNKKGKKEISQIIISNKKLFFQLSQSEKNKIKAENYEPKNIRKKVA